MNIAFNTDIQRILNTRTFQLSPLPLPSVAYVVHQLKPNSTAPVLKGFFYTLETWRTYAERNK